MKAEDKPPLEIGQVFKSMKILGLLGHGGNAWVYRVRHEFTGVERALKLIPNRQGSDYKRRAQDEAIILLKLQHGNVVRVFGADVTEDGKYVYIEMELLEGFVLRQVLDSLKHLTVTEAFFIGEQVCDAAEAAH